MKFLPISLLLISHNETFSLNTNILETNVINQILLIIILFITWGKFNTNEILANIQNNKILLISDSEKRLEHSLKTFAETKKQLVQAILILDEIKNETEKTKFELLKIDYDSSKNELSRKFKIAGISLKNGQRFLINEFRQELALLGLKLATKTLKCLVINKLDIQWCEDYLENSINKLTTLNKIR